MEKTIDIICTGELLIDYIGNELNTPISKIENYNRFLGGSPTNVAIYSAKLGLKTILVASCGNDGLGHFMIEKLKENNVNTAQIKELDNYPSSIIFVSKSSATPEFISYRQADYHIEETQIPDSLLEEAKIFHTTCFALSKNPARETILKKAKKASQLGLQTSIDLNYSDKIWPDRKEAMETIKEYMATKPLVKLSDDDCFRLFNETKSDDYILNFFSQLGAKTICLTKGKNGVVLWDSNIGTTHKKAPFVENIKDTTGAGDAFWTGFLYGKLQEKEPLECIDIAQKLASIKLQHLGQLPDNIQLENL
ncbi:carbohydrate kinase family protein [Flavobacterium sp. UMI-01]|uniref:carbohydrate kinase family protein n=1 Tax=Flavobacterium sp. UMI-01 TaxID=1441053 RepID=UPI001C7D5F1E|nr:carbohydrate kinase [Flavobacterium sp. UMI-01]GIZ07324.1 fructokinase [Flavobacterium sp. UMI-01]